jgi:hypothetical protein
MLSDAAVECQSGELHEAVKKLLAVTAHPDSEIVLKGFEFHTNRFFTCQVSTLNIKLLNPKKGLKVADGIYVLPTDDIVISHEDYLIDVIGLLHYDETIYKPPICALLE